MRAVFSIIAPDLFANLKRDDGESQNIAAKRPYQPEK
jgi:hypothetical protein